jgi:anthranilate phosphoribosyltransferase
MDAFLGGDVSRVQEAQAGSLMTVPGLPAPDAHSTATWIKAVLNGAEPTPQPIALQVAHIVHLAKSMSKTP